MSARLSQLQRHRLQPPSAPPCRTLLRAFQQVPKAETKSPAMPDTLTTMRSSNAAAQTRTAAGSRARAHTPSHGAAVLQLLPLQRDRKRHQLNTGSITSSPAHTLALPPGHRQRDARTAAQRARAGTHNTAPIMHRCLQQDYVCVSCFPDAVSPQPIAHCSCAPSCSLLLHPHGASHAAPASSEWGRALQPPDAAAAASRCWRGGRRCRHRCPTAATAAPRRCRCRSAGGCCSGSILLACKVVSQVFDNHVAVARLHWLLVDAHDQRGGGLLDAAATAL